MTKGEKRKQKLLEIAYGLFLTKGYEATSVDDIIAAAEIAKGTYYYYFESKEQMLEEVIGMMIDREAEVAEQIAASDIPAVQKMVGIISSFRPEQDEAPISDLINRPENLVMHEKTKKKLIERMVPILCGIVGEGIKDGVFACDHIPERVKILLYTGSTLFDEGGYTPADIEVFIDLVEKMLGVASGSMDIIPMAKSVRILESCST